MSLRSVKGVACSLFLFTAVAFADANDPVQDQASTCFGCHGLNGISTNPVIPHLAGQNADYLIAQLRAFQSGWRGNVIMKGISDSLNDSEIRGLAIFFSNQALEVKGNAIEPIAKGKEMYTLCWSCHGEKGEGPGSYPRIAGQHPRYLMQQLQNFKNGSRKNPAMRAIIAGMNDKEMEALTAYIATLAP